MGGNEWARVDGDDHQGSTSRVSMWAYNISGLHEFNMESRRRGGAEMPPRDNNGPEGCAGELLKADDCE